MVRDNTDVQHGSRHTLQCSFMPLSQAVLLSMTDGPRQNSQFTPFLSV